MPEDQKKGVRARAKEWFRLAFSSAPVSTEPLLKQFYVTLEANYRSIASNAAFSEAPSEDHPNSFREVEKLLRGEYSWTKAYQIEQLLAPYYADQTLDVELERRLCESELLGEDVHEFYSKITAPGHPFSGKEEFKKSIFQRLVNDFHWYYTKRIIRREYARVISVRIGMLFAIALTSFMTFLLVDSLETVTSGAEQGIRSLMGEDMSAMLLEPTPKDAQNQNNSGKPSTGAEKPANSSSPIGQATSLSVLPVISTIDTPYYGVLLALLSGVLGATFSMLVQLTNRISKGTLEDIKAACQWFSLIVRVMTGVGAAAILYFFFESGLLEGAIWPKLDDLGFAAVDLGRSGYGAPGITFHVPNKDASLLVVWSVLAGFSESFVPSILTRTESRSAAK